MRARASAKAILLGEHAVVHGVPAIAIPVRERYTEVDVVSTDASTEVTVEDERGVDTGLAAAMARLALDLTPTPARGARVKIRSNIPLGSGLGSSAALAVALVRAAARESLEPAEVARRANELERLAHGTPSGIDAATIAYERPIVFERLKRSRPLTLATPLRFSIGVLPREGTTASLVAGVRKVRETDGGRFESALNSIAAHATAAMNAASLAQWAASMSANRAALRDLGVSTPAVERACDAAIAAGALAAKLSGAGGGGTILALLGPDSDPDRVLAALRSQGALDAFVTEIPAS